MPSKFYNFLTQSTAKTCKSIFDLIYDFQGLLCITSLLELHEYYGLILIGTTGIKNNYLKIGNV